MASKHAFASLFALSAVVMITGASPAAAQLDESWVQFVNEDIDFVCGVVNASNAELVVLEDTGEMVLISGTDTVLSDVFVDDDNLVYFDGAPAGQLALFVDGDGLDAVFWVTLTDTVVGVDTFTGEPFDSGLFPEERINTGCDACQLIDESVFCEDDGGVVPIPPLCGAGIPGFAALGMVLALSLRLVGHRRSR